MPEGEQEGSAPAPDLGAVLSKIMDRLDGMEERLNHAPEASAGDDDDTGEPERGNALPPAGTGEQVSRHNEQIVRFRNVRGALWGGMARIRVPGDGEAEGHERANAVAERVLDIEGRETTVLERRIPLLVGGTEVLL
jgi:hypothetical protein